MKVNNRGFLRVAPDTAGGVGGRSLGDRAGQIPARVAPRERGGRGDARVPPPERLTQFLAMSFQRKSWLRIGLK
jgi:hypothetical protein